MTYFIDESASLSHYGVKGMKWGVRHEREKVGRKSRTRNETGFVAKHKSKIIAEKKNHGIKSIDRNTDIISKGQVLCRICMQDENPKRNATYVSILDSDRASYLKQADLLPNTRNFSDDDVIIERHYMLTKDLKVATADAVQDYILKTAGDDTIRDLIKKSKKGSDTLKAFLDKYGDTKTVDIYDINAVRRASRLLEKQTKLKEEYAAKKVPFFDTQEKNRRKNALAAFDNAMAKLDDQTNVTSKISSLMYRNKEPMIEYFKSKGYNAMVDNEDRASGTADYPLIIFDMKTVAKHDKDLSMEEAFGDIWIKTE